MKVRIFGVEFIGLLDSGASRTVIGGPGWNLLRGMGLNTKKTKLQNVTLADGNNVEILGEVEIPIELQNKVKTCEALVVREIQHHLILGADFWRTMNISANLARNSWSFAEEVLVNQIASLESRSKLTASQEEELRHIIREAENKMGKGLGCTTEVEHVIQTDSAPIKQRYYPVSPIIQKAINEELDNMLKEGIVEPSNSAWSSPVVMVRKRDGTYRFCVDFRKLNKATKKNAYPLPYVSATLDKLRDARYMSSLDIKSAFWQVPMAEGSKQYTVFTVPGRGLFQFRRMPFGLTNSPATWQRLIDKVLSGDLESHVFVYLDDVIIITQTFEDHKRILREVLNRLHSAGLVINYDKCEFCRKELRYLGYLVGENGLQVDPEKVKSILDLPHPKSVSEVRRFVGMVAWYRRFISNFSTLIAPITNLLKKNRKFQWTNDCEESFRATKDRLVSAPILTCPNFALPFVVHTDASGYGIGAVLTQVMGDDEKLLHI